MSEYVCTYMYVPCLPWWRGEVVSWWGVSKGGSEGGKRLDLEGSYRTCKYAEIDLSCF